MILDRPDLPIEDFERETGWLLKPEGACRAGVCLPLPPQGTSVDVAVLAEHLGMGVVHDDRHRLWALGPSTVSGRALNPHLGPSAEYDTDWASEVERTGVEAYYPPLDM